MDIQLRNEKSYIHLEIGIDETFTLKKLKSES